MADTTQGTEQEPSPGDLRVQLEEANKVIAGLKNENSDFQRDSALRDVEGLGHLNAKQRRAVLTDLATDGIDFSPEAAITAAQGLGYSTQTTPPTPTTTPPTTTDPAPQGNGDGNGDVEDADMTAFMLIDKARRQSATTEQGGDFEQKMRAANSKEELRDIIRTQGPRHGIIHEWDVP